MTQTPLLLAIIFLLVVLVLYIAAIKRIKKIQLELSDSNQKMKNTNLALQIILMWKRNVRSLLRKQSKNAPL